MDEREKMQDIVLAVLSHKTVKGAAQSLQISPATLYRKQQTDLYQEEMAKARNIMINSILGRLAENLEAATDKLVELAKTGNDYVALAASKEIINLTIQLQQIENLNTRLKELEKQLKQNRG
jgi:hypothetical protein